MNRRYPQIRARIGVTDPYAGVLSAADATNAFARLAKKNGVKIRENAKVAKIGKEFVTLENGERIRFDQLLVATNAWTNKLLGRKLVRSTKEQLLYFRPTKKDFRMFTKDKFPVFFYFPNRGKGFYGIPIHKINAVKISIHVAGHALDPDHKREIDPEFVKKCRVFLRKRIPLLADAKLVRTRICMYDMTKDEDFIIDHLKKNVVLACGFSGHGFKFAPLIGTILADLVLNGRTKHDIKRFRLSRFS